MFCKKCGAKNADDASFCEACGAALSPAGPVERGADVPHPQGSYAPQQPRYNPPQPNYAPQSNYAPGQQGYGNARPAKKKSHAGLIIGIVAGVLVLAGVIAAVLLLGNKGGGASATLPADPVSAFRKGMEELMVAMPENKSQSAAVRKAILPGDTVEDGTNTLNISTDMDGQEMTLKTVSALDKKSGDSAFNAVLDSGGEQMTLSNIAFLDNSLYLERMDPASQPMIRYDMPQDDWNALSEVGALNRLGLVLADFTGAESDWDDEVKGFFDELAEGRSDEEITVAAASGSLYDEGEDYTLNLEGEEARTQMLRFVELMESSPAGRDALNEVDDDNELTGSRLLRETLNSGSSVSMAVTLNTADKKAIGYTIYADVDGKEFELSQLLYSKGGEEENRRVISHFDGRGASFHSLKQSDGAAYNTTFEQYVWAAGGEQTSSISGSIRQDTNGSGSVYAGKIDATVRGSIKNITINYEDEANGSELTGSGTGEVFAHADPNDETSVDTTYYFTFERTHSDKADISRPEFIEDSGIVVDSADELYDLLFMTDTGIPESARELSQIRRLNNVFSCFAGMGADEFISGDGETYDESFQEETYDSSSEAEIPQSETYESSSAAEVPQSETSESSSGAEVPQSETSESSSAAEVPQGEQVALWSNFNGSAVASGGTEYDAVEIKIDTGCYISRIMTYHYHNYGTEPGLIGIYDSDLQLIDYWYATGAVGQGGVDNAYWVVYPDIYLEAGHYYIQDSDPSTWSNNSQSGYAGFVEVAGWEVR